MSEGWLLEREIPGTDWTDARGCYPLFAVSDWRFLSDDLDAMAGRLVSAVVVCDPFGAYSVDLLERTFDVVKPFKTHVVVDLRAFSPSRHHRRCAARALARVAVSEITGPRSFADEWCGLYENLVRRHGLTGMSAFSNASFAGQLTVPGLRLFSANAGTELVGAQMWYVSNGVAYLHLQAITALGYRLGASYALCSAALEALAAHVEHADLGGGAGLEESYADGLLQFKRGWSNAGRSAYLCGRILDPKRYRALTDGRGSAGVGYFPAYRHGELSQSSRISALTT
jgi:hypothetical protein